MNENIFYLVPSDALDSSGALVKSIQDIHTDHVKYHGETDVIYVDFYPLKICHDLKHLYHKALVKNIHGYFRVYFDAVIPTEAEMRNIRYNQQVYDDNVVGLHAPDIDIQTLLDESPLSKE